ncbi:hypothetical protein COLSTE_00945 [Collinsella stercoris DSM 13279]|uniref:Uncharacterized protein n=1 Tax=Collinsella stercoris DSM 13279 TaxID=445975 RepID=B6GA50_9ACTN|nr:hypothetical protein COLSTE_00945 [Collinsella stercoris DSM 13279]
MTSFWSRLQKLARYDKGGSSRPQPPPIRRKPYIQEGALVLDFARLLLGKRDS